MTEKEARRHQALAQAKADQAGRKMTDLLRTLSPAQLNALGEACMALQADDNPPAALIGSFALYGLALTSHALGARLLEDMVAHPDGGER